MVDNLGKPDFHVGQQVVINVGANGPFVVQVRSILAVNGAWSYVGSAEHLSHPANFTKQHATYALSDNIWKPVSQGDGSQKIRV